MTVLAGEDLDVYRSQLTGYCYRMLGCPSEAQDAVQETMLRAWRGGFRRPVQPADLALPHRDQCLRGPGA